jgi:hypothetical protein
VSAESAIRGVFLGLKKNAMAKAKGKAKASPMLHKPDDPEHQKNKAYCPLVDSLEAMVRAHETALGVKGLGLYVC